MHVFEMAIQESNVTDDTESTGEEVKNILEDKGSRKFVKRVMTFASQSEIEGKAV